jgi:hypothetical protein
MTRLSDFLAGRGPAEMYDTYWVPCLLEPFARDMAALASRGNQVLDVGCGTGLVTRSVIPPLSGGKALQKKFRSPTDRSMLS